MDDKSYKKSNGVKCLNSRKLNDFVDIRMSSNSKDTFQFRPHLNSSTPCVQNNQYSPKLVKFFFRQRAYENVVRYSVLLMTNIIQPRGLHHSEQQLQILEAPNIPRKEEETFFPARQQERPPTHPIQPPIASFDCQAGKQKWSVRFPIT